MIITCKKCQASFEIDSKIIIPEKGADITCLKCKNKFRIFPVSPSTGDGTEDFQSRHKMGKAKIRLIFGSLIMLILALGFNALLTSASLEKLYIEAIVSKYSVIAKDLKRNLENSLRFGKSLENFIGMDKLLEETQQNLIKKTDIKDSHIVKSDDWETVSEKDIIISISKPDGYILYSTNEKLINKQLPEKVLAEDPDEKKSAIAHYVKHENYYIHSLPVVGGWEKKWVATAVVAFSETQVKGLLNSIMIRNIKIIGIILLCGALLLIFLLHFIISTASNAKKIPKFKISAVLFSVIVFSQIVFTGLNTNDFKDYYLEISKEKNMVLSRILKEDIEYLLNKGISIEKLFKMDEMLDEIISVSPELDSIVVADKQGNPLYAAEKKGKNNFAENNDKENHLKDLKNIQENFDPKYHLRLELIKNNKVEGYISTDSNGFISTNISKNYLFNKLKEISLDSITVLVISIFFFVELLILEMQLLEKKISVSSLNLKKNTINFLSIRPIAFIFIFGIDICISFLPLHMANLYNPDHPIFGLSKDIVMGLPISMQMFFTSISLLISGAWCDKRGWHEPFLIGLFLSGSGFIYAWLAPNAMQFIFSLGLVGMGYGLSLMASQGFIIAHTDSKNKAQGMAQLSAGIYSGSICGGVAGGMLADRIGYQPVFFVGGGILFFLILYTFLIMRDAMQKPVLADPGQPQTQAPFKFKYILQFLFNKPIFMLIFFYGLPWYIMLVGFLNYYSPIYLKSIGTSQSNIGRIFMIYGICLMYIAPLISKYVGNSKNKKLYIIIGSFIGSLCIANFYFFKNTSGMTAVVISIFLLGISACFIPLRNAYVLDFEISQKLGGGKAMGILNSVLRLGQVSGPILFGWLFITLGSDQGIAIAGTVYLIMTLIFVLVR
ncbi:Major facilitator superfamily transporter [Desulfonema limicola]|uniref:Major facilitator superfamily transporter n=1 Tax=Desulfonema limicola TaxID=45656 RepID=A0A975BBS5_9BACT|nr:MFS transporter [Desulfonema limicola]QTA82471.1 Major facilitator superfamily transporter [Desulfonema limicola]